MPEETPGTTMKRRGLMAAAALVAGIAATKTSQPVHAIIDDVAGTPFIAQSATETAYITSQPGPPYFYDYGISVLGVATTGYGTQGTSTGTLPGVYGSNSSGNSGIGVQGDTGGSTTGYGVLGGRMNVSGSPFNGVGVHGDAASGNLKAGVSGSGVTYGVYGAVGSGGGTGVSGTSSVSGTGVNGSSGSGYGVVGTSGYVGVRGYISSATGTANTIGVQGQNNATGAGGYGVQGISAHSHGVYAEACTNQDAGALVGVARSAGTVGFQALAVSPAVYAGFFSGTVSVIGSLGVTGGKFAVVKGQDGKYRGMYAVESPECWFEDAGEGTLAGGKADVKLDPLFVQHVHADSYHVFLTEHDTHHHLSVANRAAGGFSVAADVDGAKLKGKAVADLNGTFSWRVIAKRNDIAGERMPI